MAIIRILRNRARDLRDKVLLPLHPRRSTNHFNSQIQQKLLQLEYRRMLESKLLLPSYRDVGFRVYSETDDDGLLLFVFSLINFRTYSAVEIACGVAETSITANLIINHNFDALMFEFDDEAVRHARQFYLLNKDTDLRQPLIVQAWITTENVNELISENGFTGEIDLLVLDVNGVDYWLWDCIDVIDPRVVVIECNLLWPHDVAVTVPNMEDFWRFNYDKHYFGCSAAAAVKLGNEKNYRLVAVNNYGHNLVFVKEDIIKDILPEIRPEEFHNSRIQKALRDRHLAGIQSREWVEV